MNTLSFNIMGDVQLHVAISEQADGSLLFEVEVTSETGSIGDLNGLFFDLADATLLPGLTVSGDDVTGVVMDEDAVTRVDNYNNLNGEVIKDLGRFDTGVQFGTQGIAEDDIRSTSFVLAHDSVDLTLDLILGMDFAARLTSVGTEDGARDGSIKIGTTAPSEPDDSGPSNIAGDDSMTVSSANGFDVFGFPDPLDDFVLSLLDNDTSDGIDYDGLITSVNGQSFTDGMIVTGSDGGLLQVNSDGTVDFSANGDFDYLTGDMTTTTQFTYTIDGGDEAVLTVTVFAHGGDPGGPIGVSSSDPSFDVA